MRLLGLLLITCFLLKSSADADLWGHLTFGRDIAQAHVIRTDDPYSFTSDREWINHEWLAELLMWWSYTIAGPLGLVCLKALLIGGIGWLVLLRWDGLRRISAPRELLLLGVALGIWPTTATVRPQLFSLFLFSALLIVLEWLRNRPWHLLWAVPPIFALWANLHGGWIVGALTLIIVACCELAGFESGHCRRPFVFLVVGVASAVAVLCNPYGYKLVLFIADTVRPTRSDILEWQSVLALPIVAAALWSIPTALAVAAFWKARGIPMASTITVVALALLSFRAARLMSFYALAIGILVLPYAWEGRLADGQRTPRTRSAGLSSVLACLLILSVSVALVGRRIPMDGPWLPEPDAVEYLRAHGLQGKMLTWFDYGEYAIWHLAPGIRVSMDGRRETVYSPRVREMHQHIYKDLPDALENVRALNPSSVWLPSDLPVIHTLESVGWRTVFAGDRSVILTRESSIPVVTSLATTERRFFPGP